MSASTVSAFSVKEKCDGCGCDTRNWDLAKLQRHQSICKRYRNRQRQKQETLHDSSVKVLSFVADEKSKEPVKQETASKKALNQTSGTGNNSSYCPQTTEANHLSVLFAPDQEHPILTQALETYEKQYNHKQDAYASSMPWYVLDCFSDVPIKQVD